MNPQQMQMMQQMFQNPNGGGGMPLPQGGGGGVGAGIGPSFQGPQGAPGVQPLPFNGPMPDFTMGPYDPSQDPGFDPLGGGQNGPLPMPAGRPGWSPAAAGGQSIGRPMPADPSRPGTARPMPMPMPQGRPDQMGNGAYPRNMGGGVQGAAGMRGSDGMSRVPSRMGPNMDRMPQSGNPNGPNMDNMPSGPMDEEKRRALIQAIIAKQFGG